MQTDRKDNQNRKEKKIEKKGEMNVDGRLNLNQGRSS